MSQIIRDALYKKVSQCLQDVDPKKVLSLVSTSSLNLDEKTNSFHISLYPKIIKNSEQALQNIKKDDLFKNLNFVSDNNVVKKITIECSRNDLVRSILENNVERVEPVEFLKDRKKVVVDFSSPNIAKPFHMGHLRSTIIGNYVSNISTYLGNRVSKINYLGDWGTQFGFVLLGLSQARDEEMKSNSIETLYNIYVQTNRAAETDPTISEQARNIFENMEKGHSDYHEKWQTIKRYTVDELSKTYKRLGVQFDEYHWESMYSASNIQNILSIMENQGLLVEDDEKRKVIDVNNKTVPILKSDGSTLYLTRDIAAAVDRFERFHFDAMYYVVDNSQAAHFSNLIGALKKLEFPWADRVNHVRFGRINGMSTRRGTAVFLKDLLDEIREVMFRKQLESTTTKVQLDEPDESTDILGISAVIVNDFRHKRVSSYDFDWNEALDNKSQSGVKLQYAHARLVSLEENCDVQLPSQSDPKYLQEPCVNDLLLILGQFDEVVYKSYLELEPYILTKYLFRLSHSINIAFKQLKIKGEPQELASQRLLLFRVSRNILAQGLKLLGIIPLSKL